MSACTSAGNESYSYKILSWRICDSIWKIPFWAKSDLFLSLGFSQASGMSSDTTSPSLEQSSSSVHSPSSLHLPENRRTRDRSPSPMRGYLIPSPLPTRRTRTFSAWVLGKLHLVGTAKCLLLGRLLSPAWREGEFVVSGRCFGILLLFSSPQYYNPTTFVSLNCL